MVLRDAWDIRDAEWSTWSIDELHDWAEQAWTVFRRRAWPAAQTAYVTAAANGAKDARFEDYLPPFAQQPRPLVSMAQRDLLTGRELLLLSQELHDLVRGDAGA